MTAKGNRLRAVPPLVGKTGFQYRFDVAAQAIAAGTQDVCVRAITPLFGSGKGQIGVSCRSAPGLRLGPAGTRILCGRVASGSDIGR